jgi:hypothetical protein
MDAKTQEHFDQLPEENKKELYSLVDMIEKQDHDNAMKVVQDSKIPLTEGYTFSHYVIKGVGNQESTPNYESALKAIAERLDNYRMEVTAILKNPKYSFPDDRMCLERSILYINTEKNTFFLEGQEIHGIIDGNKLVEIIKSYKK